MILPVSIFRNLKLDKNKWKIQNSKFKTTFKISYISLLNETLKSSSFNSGGESSINILSNNIRLSISTLTHESPRIVLILELKKEQFEKMIKSKRLI